MSRTIISKDSITQAEIQANIDAFLLANESYLPLNGTKGMDVITELLAGFGAYLAYNNQTLREETYIETVKSNQGIAMQAIDYSYRINRPTSPTLSLTYMGLTPLTLTKGQILGSYVDYNVVYTGKNRTLVSGSTIEVSLGLLKTETFVIDKSKGVWTIDINPSTYAYVENTLVYIKSGSNFLNLSKALENLYLGNAVDYSIGINSARVWLYDSLLSMGSNVVSESSVEVAYLEVDGNFVVSEADLSLDANYVMTSILSNGARADDYLYVKSILPFFNQTYRQAVSETDFNYLCKPFKYFRDCAYVHDRGIPFKVRVNVKDMYVGTTYDFSISSSVGDYIESPFVENYSYTVKIDDNYDTIVKAITDLISSTSSLMRVVYPTVGTVFHLEAFSASQEVNLTVSMNMALHTETLNQVPGQNLGYLYYSHAEIDKGTKSLTYYEQQAFLDYFNPYKIAGTTILLKPAVVAGYSFHLKVQLVDTSYLALFETMLSGYLGVFNYSINTDFIVAKALRDIALFTYEGVKFVTEINSDTVIDYNGLVDHYLLISVDKSVSYVS